MSYEKSNKEEMRVTEKDASQEGISKKASKKKPLIIGLIVLFVLALGVVGFALTNNGCNEQEYIPEILENEEEIVEVEEVSEEMEQNTDVNFSFLVDEDLANRVLNVMNLTLVERKDTDRFYDFDVEDLLEGIVVNSEDISDGVYYITSLRPPVTKDAELLVLSNLLKYDLEVIDGVPAFIEKPEITCCIDAHNCEDYYCTYGECAVECLVKREYDEKLMYFNEDGEIVVHLPLVVVPVEEQSNEELLYVISEITSWLQNNPDADEELREQVENALENAIAEQEYREQANIEDDEEDTEDVDTGTGTDNDSNADTSGGGNNTTGGGSGGVNNPPADGGGGNQGGGTAPPPNNPPACNHNWVANGSNQTQTTPGTWVWRHHCHECDFITYCETTMFNHTLGHITGGGFAGSWIKEVYQPGGTTTVWVPDGTYNCSICGVRR